VSAAQEVRPKHAQEVSRERRDRLEAAKGGPAADPAGLLFRQGDRHLTAESLHDEAQATGIGVSLATVYNTLNQFTEAGLLRQVVVDAARSYFDTNTCEHQHFYCEDENRLIDIPGDSIAVAGVPTPPKGTRIERVDVVIRLRRG
jgi:Fur family iron response transcriptional regulator